MNINGIFSNGQRPHGTTFIYHIGALVAVTAWGLAFINTKILLNYGLTAVEIYLLRFFIAYIMVLMFCPRPLFSRSFADESKFILCGLCGNSIYFIAENTALNFTLVTNVSLIVTLAPIITMLMMCGLYRNHKPSHGFWVGSVVAFIGVSLVVFNSSFVVKVKPFGDLLALLAAVCWAIYSLLLRPLNATYSVWFITRKTFFYGLITALPFALVEPHLVSVATLMQPTVLGNLLFLGVFPSMLAYVLWAQTVKTLGVATSSNYLYISPVVTLVASYVVLGESISVIGYAGSGLILLGVILSEKLSRK